MRITLTAFNMMRHIKTIFENEICPIKNFYIHSILILLIAVGGLTGPLSFLQGLLANLIMNLVGLVFTPFL